MLLLGLDIGTSSVKASVVDAVTKKVLVSVQYPQNERLIKSLELGWAEQSPMQWWDDVKSVITKANATKLYHPNDIGAIGIAYQMHGLVLIDKNQQVLRDAIIWCDSRAVEIGNKAFADIGQEECLTHLLNSPGNFTASKLAWVKHNEPLTYSRIDKVLLPGDYISSKLTGEITTTVTALSEGIFWDFKNNELSKDIIEYFGFDKSFFPSVRNVFEEHGTLSSTVANELGLRSGITVNYKAGDQPNNALSLNVLNPGEVAATAGTSGVIYAVGDQLSYDAASRVNGFAHVNHGVETRIGTLLCINGCGSMNRLIKERFGKGLTYDEMNTAARSITPGSNGLNILPFCNGAERILKNKLIDIDLSFVNKHNASEIFRATQEGIAYAFRYGLDIMRSNNIHPKVIKAGRANMFLSDVFTQVFADVTDVPVEIYDCDGSVGAAIGAGIGKKIFSPKQAFENISPLQLIEPSQHDQYDALYYKWERKLYKILNNN
ncbi:xylulokinase [Ferruginibacter sp. SUN002]|uniref:xylulokinase n=1 Tax=Ferruginibacter sp. SUN002 TaxID=2937789 RepID=UPI003D360A03